MTKSPAAPDHPRSEPPLRKALRGALQRSGSALEAHSFIAFGLLLLIYLFAELGYSFDAPLWHDELFTFYIAQAPSLHAMLDQIRTVDLNPPLSYLLTRLSFHLFGAGTLQCRLPEIAGFALALLGVFAFVRRRAGNAFALLAAALLFGSRAGELVFQARPYGLMLGTSALALAFWQAASAPTRKGPPRSSWAELGLFFALTALLLTHIFGLFSWAALLVAEAVQSGRRRRVAPLRLAAMLLPLAATLLYLPMLQNHAKSAFPAAFQPTGNDIFLFYMGHVDRELICLWLSAFVIVLLAGKSWLRGSSSFVLTQAEWVAVCGLIAAPLILIGLLMLTHGAFFDRYGVIACLGTSVLFSVLFCFWTGNRAGAALVAIVIALLITGRLPNAVSTVSAAQVFRHTEPRVVPLNISLLQDPRLPLVTSSGLTFLEMQRREPDPLLSRTFYLTDSSAALTQAHATIFEGMALEARLFPIRSHVEPYAQFVSEHPVFYVLGTYDYPEDWLLRRLQANGAQLQVLGRVEGSYKDHELYKVQSPDSRSTNRPLQP